MHIADFFSRTFAGNKDIEKNPAGYITKSSRWYGDLDNKRHGTCWCATIFKSYWLMICANLRAHKTIHSTAIPESDNFS